MIAEYIGARTDQGPFRSANQDTYWVSSAADPLELGELYIVADGVGGQEHGTAAAQLAVQMISEQFYRLRGDGLPVPDSLSQSIHRANATIYEQAQERGGIKMGCTIVAAVLHKKTVYIAHVGDARIYFFHKNKLQQLTRDDSWVQEQLDAGVITPEEAETHQFRNVVTQVLGNKIDILVHQRQWDGIHQHDRLLLCSDGLHGVLDTTELMALLMSDAPQAADDLVQAAITAGTQDNVTAIVVQLDKRGGTGRSRPAIPLWVTVTLVTLFLFFMAWGGRIAWSSYNANNDGVVDTDGQNGDVLPTLQPTAEPPVNSQPTETIMPTAVLPTETPLPTSTIALPTETPLSPTAALPPSPPPPALRNEIIGRIAYVWTDEQVQSGNCEQTSRSSLQTGTIVRIIEESNSIEIQGPDEGCQLNRFIKIQVEDGSGQIGWVLAINVKQLLSDN